MDCEATANQLDRLLPILATAAALAGIKNTREDPTLIGLCLHIEPSVHRRRLWEAWQSHGQCGRWPALLKLDGVHIKATSLDSHAPYDLPKPMETRVEQIANGISRERAVDPHDPGYRPAAQPMQPRRTTGTRSSSEMPSTPNDPTRVSVSKSEARQAIPARHPAVGGGPPNEARRQHLALRGLRARRWWPDRVCGTRIPLQEKVIHDGSKERPAR